MTSCRRYATRRQRGLWNDDRPFISCNYDGKANLIGEIIRDCDATFIAYSRTTMPALIAAVRERDAEIERLRVELAVERKSAFALAANQCHKGYGDEYGNHRCGYQDVILGLEVRLAELLEADSWQPIETAPKDGTNILGGIIGLERSVGKIFWWKGGWRTWDGKNHQNTVHYPTHWRPLPAPPKS